MAGASVPCPLGVGHNAPRLDRGTSATLATPVPGVVHHELPLAHRHVSRELATPAAEGGWSLVDTRVTYRIDHTVPAPLHSAIRQGVRHWNRALARAGISLHYVYGGTGTGRLLGNSHLFTMVELLVVRPDETGRPRIIAAPGQERTHAYTEIPEPGRASQSITTMFNRDGLVVPDSSTVVEGRQRGVLRGYADCAHAYILGVVVHEIGHAMGIDHLAASAESPEIDSVMVGPGAGTDRTNPTANDMETIVLRARRERISHRRYR